MILSFFGSLHIHIDLSPPSLGGVERLTGCWLMLESRRYVCVITDHEHPELVPSVGALLSESETLLGDIPLIAHHDVTRRAGGKNIAVPTSQSSVL